MARITDDFLERFLREAVSEFEFVAKLPEEPISMEARDGRCIIRFANHPTMIVRERVVTYPPEMLPRPEPGDQVEVIVLEPKYEH